MTTSPILILILPSASCQVLLYHFLSMLTKKLSNFQEKMHVHCSWHDSKGNFWQDDEDRNSNFKICSCQTKYDQVSNYEPACRTSTLHPPYLYLCISCTVTHTCKGDLKETSFIQCFSLWCNAMRINDCRVINIGHRLATTEISEWQAESHCKCTSVG